LINRKNTFTLDALIDGMLTLKKVLRRERQLKLLLLGIVLLMGLGFAYLGYALEQGAALFTILALITAIGAIWFVRDIVRYWQLEKSPLLQTIQYAPKSIVWIYTIEVQLMPLGVQFWDSKTLNFCLVDRDELQIRATEQELQLIKKALVILLPHTTFGHNREREQWYELDPNMLYRDEEE
jgi:uncharacterized membrane protein